MKRQKKNSKKQYTKPASRGSVVQLYTKKVPEFELLIAALTE